MDKDFLMMFIFIFTLWYPTVYVNEMGILQGGVKAKLLDLGEQTVQSRTGKKSIVE